MPAPSPIAPHYKALNGLDFSRSVKNPNSRIAKVVRYLLENGPRTKRQILEDVFKVREFVPTATQRYGYKSADGYTYVVRVRGQHAYLFSGGVTCGFLVKHNRVGNSVKYSAGQYSYMVRV